MLSTEAGGSELEGDLITAEAWAGHQSVTWEQYYCASLLSLSPTHIFFTIIIIIIIILIINILFCLYYPNVLNLTHKFYFSPWFSFAQGKAERGEVRSCVGVSC